MFGKKKATENRYIVAVKNYDETLGLLKNGGKISLPYEKSVYLKMLETQTSKVDSFKGIRKFAKENSKSMSEVGHYWEGLIEDGYTLVNVEYIEKIPSIDHVCNSPTIKYVCAS